ncbi:hypothetical protein LR48_Vigan665s000500 [Vigna angularis]|uniref:Uncharacterized protein n=1 Tax=Phaseolus angularis TaxID=3914 RepID=A0A0L9TFL8_PHAAN|nr:hypothetical protein LR48_Vigan665s000500 [Vigna angularis]
MWMLQEFHHRVCTSFQKGISIVLPKAKRVAAPSVTPHCWTPKLVILHPDSAARPYLGLRYSTARLGVGGRPPGVHREKPFPPRPTLGQEQCPSGSHQLLVLPSARAARSASAGEKSAVRHQASVRSIACEIIRSPIFIVCECFNRVPPDPVETIIVCLMTGLSYYIRGLGPPKFFSLVY